MTFGEKIQKLRKEKGLSQEELAEHLEVSRQSISNWERDNGLPEIEKIIRMSNLFQVTIDSLLREECTAQEPLPKEAGAFYVSQEMASSFLFYHKQKRMKAGLAAGLLIGGTACSFFELASSSAIYAAIAVVSILLLISSRPFSGFNYRKIRKGKICFDAEVKRKILSDYADRKKICYIMNLIGAALLLAGIFICPLIPGDIGLSTAFGMMLAGLGAFFCIYWNGIAKSYRILTADIS